MRLAGVVAAAALAGSGGLQLSGESQGGSATVTSVAVINVGLARSVMHPKVASSFALLKDSLVRDGHRVRTFMYLGIDPGDDAAEAANGARDLYRATKVWVTKRDLPCNAGCPSVDCTPGHDKPFGFLQQFYKVRLAFDRVADWEREHGLRFAWFLKVRPDLLWFEALPRLSTFAAAGNISDGDSVYVPHGVMTSKEHYQRLNDHALLCPRRLCTPYFRDLHTRYQQCSASSPLKIPKPPQQLVFEPYQNQVGLIDIGYTVARPEEGPSCVRMACSKLAASTGCVAPHLQSFVEACNRASREWRGAEGKNAGGVRAGRRARRA